jgi:ATP-binding cassette subfamily C protein
VTAATATLRSARHFIAAIFRMTPGLALTTVALTCAGGFLQGVGLLVLVPLLQLVGIDAQQGSLGRILAMFRSAFAAVGLEPTLPSVLLLYVAVVAVESILHRYEAVTQARLRERLVHALRTRVYKAVAATTWVYFSTRRASTFGQILTDRIDRVATAVYYLNDLFVTFVMCVVYMAMAFQVSPAMTTFVVTCGAVMALALRGMLAKARAAGERYTEASTQLHAAVADHLGSMKLAKSYGAEESHHERLTRLSDALGAASLSAMTASVTTRQWIAIGSAGLLALIVYVAQTAAALSAASLFLIVFLFARLVPRVTSLYERAQILALELPAYESIIEAETECLAAAEPRVTVHAATPLQHALECRHVTFRYGSAPEVAALRDVTLRVAAHETTAIVGPSGAGKSTIADLLMGLITPADGTVTIDDEPLTAERMRSWRSRIGYVSQETFLFHDTIRANLRWAHAAATDDLMWDALERAAADEFVRALPAGLDTVVGDRGVLLSGGERQRLSLARALLRRPEVLILDEATSSLDSENERRIQAAIDRLHEQVTIVIITHRLSTIRKADVIYVIEGGRIVESGTWRTLTTARTSRFRSLCDAQGVDASFTATRDDLATI